MIFFYDIAFNLLSMQRESSFSYNKKENKEGSGKIELLELPPSQAFYIIAYTENEIIGNPAVEIKNEITIKAIKAKEVQDKEINNSIDKNYIASGYITEYSKNENTISLTFKSFDSLLKGFKLPKTWSIYNGEKLPLVIADLFTAFFPIYKSSKYELKGETSNCLERNNIAFEEITNGDLHLAFKEKDFTENNFKFADYGYIIYAFDLGDAIPINSHFNIAGKIEDDEAFYPMRTLRYEAQIGSKTFINCYAIGKDTPFTKDYFKSKEHLEEIKKEKIDFKRSIKDYEKNTGALLPSSAQKNRYVAIMFELIYKDADYVNDFVTHEVYQINSEEPAKQIKVKRTVRGFTPIIKGFCLLNRINIPPFTNIETDNESFESNVIYSCKNKELKDVIVNNIKFDGISLFESLTRLATDYKFNFAFDLKLVDKSKKIHFFISIYQDEHQNKNAIYGKESKSHFHSKDINIPLIANTNIKNLQKKIKMCILLQCKSKGEDMDAMHAVLFSQEEVEGRVTKINIYLYNPMEASGMSLNDEGLQNIGIAGVRTTLPKNVFFITETFEDTEEKKGKDYTTFLANASTFLQKKIEEDALTSLEIETIEEGHIGDIVTFIHPESKSVFEARIIEEKTNIKNGSIKKQYAIGTGFFNPFDALFNKKENYHFFDIPHTPLNIEITSKEKTLFIEWLPVGSYDGFSIEIERLDGIKEFANNARYIDCTTSNKIEIKALRIGVIYSVKVASYKGTKLSEHSSKTYIKLSEDKFTHRMLNSLNEIPKDEDEVGFFFTEEERKKINKTGLERIIKDDYLKRRRPVNLNKYNSVEELSKDTTLNLDLLYDEELEALERYYGLEYIWNNQKWVPRKIIIPYDPHMFFNYNPENLIPQYDKEFVKLYENYYEKVSEWQKVRGKLNEMERIWQLPHRLQHLPEYQTFSVGNENAKNEKENEIKTQGELQPKDPIMPPPITPWPIKPNPTFPIDPNPIVPNPLKPNPDKPEPLPHPDEDTRLVPDDEKKKEYQEARDQYSKLREKIVNLHSQLEKKIKKKGILKLYDCSFAKQNMEYNLPAFHLLKNEPVITNIGELLNPRQNENEKNENVKSLHYAFSFYYAALDLGGYKHIKGESFKDKDNVVIPKYIVKNVIKKKWESDDSTYYDFTFSTYINVYKAVGDIEVWNIGGFCIGLLKDDVLHFATKRGDEYYIFYSRKLFLKKEGNITSPLLNPYIHIIVYCYIEHSCSSDEGFGNFRHTYTITQKIYIDSKEIKESEYNKKNDEENGTSSWNTLKYTTRDYIPIHKDVSFFNINLKPEYKYKTIINEDRRRERVSEPIDYCNSEYDVSLSNTLLFNYKFNWGMVKWFQENINYPVQNENKIKEKTPNKNENTVNNIKSSFVGICIEKVDSNNNVISIVGKSEKIHLKSEDYFLMAKTIGSFKSATIYKYAEKLPENKDGWIGNYLELLPRSSYKKEYALAFEKINPILSLLQDTSFKEFFLNSFSIISTLFSNDIQTQNLIVKDEIILDNLSESDPNIKGAIYRNGNQLLISLGDKK